MENQSITNENIINNLLTEICTKIEWKDNETYLSWLRTEIGIDEEAMERLKNENCLPLPYARK